MFEKDIKTPQICKFCREVGSNPSVQRIYEIPRKSFFYYIIYYKILYAFL